MRTLIQTTQRNHTKELAPFDLTFKKVGYVYAVTMVQRGLGSQVEEYATVPYPFPCSLQERAMQGELVDPNAPPGRYCRIFTRQRNAFKWHDKIVCENISWQVEMVAEKQANYKGGFQYLEGRAVYLGEPGSIKKA